MNEKVFLAGKTDTSNLYNRIYSRQGITPDVALANDMTGIWNDFERNTSISSRPKSVAQYIGRLNAHQGMRLRGQAYQNLHTELDASIAGAENKATEQALSRLRNALDANMDRTMTGPTARQDRLDLARAKSQWRHLKILEKAAKGAGGRPPPWARYRRRASATAIGDDYIYGKGTYGDLARSAKSVIETKQQSGTEPRSRARILSSLPGTSLGTAIGGGATGYVTGDISSMGLGAALGAAGGAASSAMLGKALLNPAVGRLVGNQIFGGTRTGMGEELRNSIAKALQQASPRKAGGNSGPNMARTGTRFEDQPWHVIPQAS